MPAYCWCCSPASWRASFPPIGYLLGINRSAGPDARVGKTIRLYYLAATY